MTVGCPGGDNQAQANIQLMLNVILFGMDPQQAVEAPRFSTMSNVNSFYPHVYHPGRMDLEEGIPETTAEDLRGLGPQDCPGRRLRHGCDGFCPGHGDGPPEHGRRSPPGVLRHRPVAFPRTGAEWGGQECPPLFVSLRCDEIGLSGFVFPSNCWI